MLRQAIDRYHGLLTEELAEESRAQLEARLRERGLYFGQRPLCSVLRPRFLTPGQYRYLQGRCAVLLRALGKVHERAMADADFRAQLHLWDWEEELLADDPGFTDPTPVSRLDAFFVHERGGLRFTEYNAETPAAAAFNDALADVFLGLPVMREFLRRYEVLGQASRHHVLHALLDAHRRWAGTAARPTVAILDWRDVPTYSEFVLSADFFGSQGITTVIADPREVEYRNGRLRAGSEAIDLVYKRVLLSELVEREGLGHPVIRAVRDGAVCMVNPFRCKLLHKKASLAVLHDERNAELLDEEEREAVRAHIPWTRTLEERTTVHGGREVDLLPFVAENRERLVLKPNDEYGGEGVVLGWECEPELWEAAVRRGLEEPTVVQERVDIPTEVYPTVVDGRLAFEERILDTAPFAFYGRYVDGCLTRLSTESLVNVTAGGGSSLATLVVAER